MASFTEKIARSWALNQSMLTLGLDPDPKRFPTHLQGHPDALYEFCRQMVDACAPYTCAFKPQIAYFSSAAAEAQLQAICAYIKERYPDHLLILDAKRGDIGTTAEHYAREAFERFQADAVTVNPYMGYDSVAPFLEWSDKGIFILCRTSNAGGSDLQFLNLADGTPLYLHVARMIAQQWDRHNQCGLVVGATFPNEIARIRQEVGDMPLLIPGIGAQGGNIEQTVAAGINSQGLGMFINSARAILYASNQEDWLHAAQKMAQQTHQAIQHALQASAQS